MKKKKKNIVITDVVHRRTHPYNARPPRAGAHRNVCTLYALCTVRVTNSEVTDDGGKEKKKKTRFSPEPLSSVSRAN